MSNNFKDSYKKTLGYVSVLLLHKGSSNLINLLLKCRRHLGSYKHKRETIKLTAISKGFNLHLGEYLSRLLRRNKHLLK